MKDLFRQILVTLFISGVVTLMVGCTENEDQVSMKLLFAMRGDSLHKNDFVAITTNPFIIEKARAELSRPLSERTFHINGKIERGHGGHNLNWNWHFVANAWDLVEVSAEVCDGSPEMVENDLDYWVDNLGTFCPWGSFVLAELTEKVQ